ncbi:hypothetical protein [Pedobacter puniceum]|uniref:DUF1080 domain-containing protein n=1 Tax=Pedobacter puniceum TaxID=2666136 RepID=A0A7K0FQT5_9SPHI|nr:hypothetical protein [Pedobacter puniceum]MRX48324.1 hypothetical protein [Pedobacter puniceum]
MKKITLITILLAVSTQIIAQIPVTSITWENYNPKKKIHLCNEVGKHMMYDWTAHQELHTSVGKNASYTYNPKDKTETFQLYDKKSNRAEIRLINEYEYGARQFEGYVTIFKPLDDECLMQIWGSHEGATQFMLRGFHEDNGSLTINCGSSSRVKVMNNIYGKEIKVNVIHLQEDVGNKFMVYLNDKKVFELPDNEKAINNFNGNYHKYGVYGTVRDGHESPKVIWRNVQHFKDKGGKMYDKQEQKINYPPLAVKKVGDADFDAGASSSAKLPLIYRSSDLTVATITPEGKVHIVGPGKTLILAFHEGNHQYHPNSELRELVVEK